MWFITNPVGRVVGIAIIAITLVTAAGLTWKIHQNGQTIGKLSESLRQADMSVKALEADKAVYIQQRDESIKRQREAIELAERFQARAEQLTRTLADIDARRAADRSRVSALSDTALLADLIQKLAVREQGDSTPELTPAEKRRVDEIVTDYPLVVSENKVLHEKVAAVEGKVAAIEQQTEALRDQLRATTSYVLRLESEYARLYNSYPRKGNWFLRLITFGAKGKPKQLPFPSPKDLSRQAPQ